MSVPAGAADQAPRGLLKVLGLMSKAEHEAEMAAQRDRLEGGASKLTSTTAHLNHARAELAARTAESDELKRREGLLTAQLQAKEEEAVRVGQAYEALCRRVAALDKSAAELSRRELEESIYVPFSSDFSVRMRSGRVALALGTNAVGSRVGSALYLRLRPGVSLGGSVAYNVQSDVVERMLLGGTVQGGSHAFKVAAERHGVVNLLYSLKVSSSMNLMVKAQVNESHSTLRNLGASLALNL